TGAQNGEIFSASYSNSATPASPFGNYAIQPGLLDPDGKGSNYTVVVSNGVFRITRAPLTVTANSTSRGYGSPNPDFTGTIVGLMNSDNITATYRTDATPSSPLGTYAIVPS